MNLSEWLKDHKLAAGGILAAVLVLFIVIMRRGGSASTASSATSSDSSALQAEEQAGAVQASTAQQNAQLAAQEQIAQISAQSTQQQTTAGLTATQDQDATELAADLAGVSSQNTVAELQAGISNNQTQAAVDENRDTLNFASQEVGMQDSVLEDQINSSYDASALADSTALQGAQDEYNYGLGLANISAGVAVAGLPLAEQEESDYNSTTNAILNQAGTPQNSALDAQDQTSIFQTILARGNPGVAAAGDKASSTAVVSGNNTGLASETALLNTGAELLGDVL